MFIFTLTWTKSCSSLSYFQSYWFTGMNAVTCRSSHHWNYSYVTHGDRLSWWGKLGRFGKISWNNSRYPFKEIQGFLYSTGPSSSILYCEQNTTPATTCQRQRGHFWLGSSHIISRSQCQCGYHSPKESSGCWKGGQWTGLTSVTSNMGLYSPS